MLSRYYRGPSCDYTNKIIKRSTKGKLRAEQHILRHKEYKLHTTRESHSFRRLYKRRP